MTFPPKKLRSRAVALAANEFKFANARQPLALALPLKSNGDSARPVGSSGTAYIKSLTRKTGQCRFVASQLLAQMRSADMRRECLLTGELQT